MASSQEVGNEIVEEADVEIDLAVVRAVERTHRLGRGPARGSGRIREQDGSCGVVRLAAPSELVAPELLDAVDEPDDAAIGAPVRVSAGLAILDRRAVVDGRGRARVVRERIEAEDHRRDQQQEADAVEFKRTG